MTWQVHSSALALGLDVQQRNTSRQTSSAKLTCHPNPACMKLFQLDGALDFAAMPISSCPRQVSYFGFQDHELSQYVFLENEPNRPQRRRFCQSSRSGGVPRWRSRQHISGWQGWGNLPSNAMSRVRRSLATEASSTKSPLLKYSLHSPSSARAVSLLS